MDDDLVLIFRKRVEITCRLDLGAKAIDWRDLGEEFRRVTRLLPRI